MKKLPLGIQAFSNFIEDDYLYVDKTEHIHSLLAGSGKYFFLSRPRRFGKSVLVSTLVEIFSGNKELFKGLWIYDKIGWEKYPVIYLDFSKIDFETTDILKESLKLFLNETAAAYGITLSTKLSYKQAFVQLIKQCSSQGRVVILIDEYDKPIINNMEVNKLEKANQIREILKSFFSVIKGSDQYLRFVLITGVSKFSRVSIFSDLNNLTDITLHPQYAALLGYTQVELEHNFSSYIEQLAEQRGESRASLLETIRKWYNGYSWDGKTFVYNPYSIVNFFYAGSFENFWFTTGTPTLLIDMIRNQQVNVVDFEKLKAYSYTFDSFDFEKIGIAALLFQTGYVTIKKITVEDEEKTYDLAYPNYEVKSSFLTHLLGAYTLADGNFDAGMLKRLGKAIKGKQGDSPG